MSGGLEENFLLLRAVTGLPSTGRHLIYAGRSGTGAAPDPERIGRALDIRAKAEGGSSAHQMRATGARADAIKDGLVLPTSTSAA
ncbi:hypothetical protein [Methylobacterium sp. 22177]|uniref:hypothetical protein n=1 Tax=Methylobacterium sp. 22177 TaxID=3453885 RepID=UPI003F83C0A4